MFSLPRTQTRAICSAISRHPIRAIPIATTPLRSLASQARKPLFHPSLSPHPQATSSSPTTISHRAYSTKSAADAIIETLTEQYGTARDEFEIASEETDKKSIYAADDREAAMEEWETLKEMYERALEGEHGEEVRLRVGHRIRELERGMEALQERAQED